METKMKHNSVTPLVEFYNLYSLVASQDNDCFHVVTRYDGHGNSRVYFLLRINGKDTEYEKFNAAAGAWNNHLEMLRYKDMITKQNDIHK